MLTRIGFSAALLISGLFLMSCGDSAPTAKAPAYYVENPDEIEPALEACRAGRLDVTACSSVERAQKIIEARQRSAAFNRNKRED